MAAHERTWHTRSWQTKARHEDGRLPQRIETPRTDSTIARHPVWLPIRRAGRKPPLELQARTLRITLPMGGLHKLHKEVTVNTVIPSGIANQAGQKARQFGGADNRLAIKHLDDIGKIRTKPRGPEGNAESEPHVNE